MKFPKAIEKVRRCGDIWHSGSLKIVRISLSSPCSI
jgi:hypothetical protein